MKKITILTFLFIAFAGFTSIAQTTVYVSATGAGQNDGTSEADARGSFGDAMNDINSAGDKLIIIGTVSTSGANLTSKSFAFTIEGLDASSTLTGDGGTGRLFTINGATSADVTFKDLTFSGNNTTLAGGAVLFSNNGGATATFENCTFSGNSVTHGAGGGAIFFANGTLNIIDSSFENNTSSDEGGAIVANSGTITITNTLFETNSAASKGGAIYTTNGDFTITGSTFYDNETTGAGGGSAFYVASSGSTNSITNCTFFQNTTANANQDYGTIRTDNGNTTVTNSLFYDNKTNNDTGAPSDWGSGPGGTQTFNTSIAQWISTNIDNQDEGTGSITGIKGGGGTAADLSASNLTFNAASGYVEYNTVDEGTDSPIGFGSDGNDVGAWSYVAPPSDTTAPVITVLGDNPASVEQGATYTDAGATADGGETVSSSGTVDTSTVGAYTITYSATDAANNTGTATRTVNVVAPTQTTVYVSATGAGASDGTSVENAYGNFATALAEINSEGDILRVIGDINLTDGQNISSKTFAFTIEGDSDLSTLTGADGIVRMFTINSGTGHNVTFKNLIITGATNSTGPGAVIGVYTNSTLTIDNCVFNGNSSINATGGGAILINNSSANLTVNDTSFYQNSSTASAGQGGAIAILASASAALTNCTFFENTITRTDKNFGGAIRTNSTSPLTVTNCLFYNNKANNGAGGNSDVMGTPTSGRTITNSILQFTNNTGSGSYTNNNSTITDSDFLSTSNLSWDATLNKVTFTAPDALTNDTPIDFGTDTSDVGAYDSNINIFIATTNNTWNETTNWSNGALPVSTDNVAVLSGAEVTLNTDATIVDLKVKANLKINQGKSLIVTGDVTGDDNKVYYRRTLTAIADNAEGWHLVASPVSGETYDDAYVTAEGIASGSGNNRGIASYVTSDDSWDYMQAGESNTFTSGLGYTMKRSSTGQVKFIGNLNTNDAGVNATISTVGQGYNLLGNPYTAFINSQTFLTDNNANLEQQIWVWDQTGGGNYLVKIAGEAFEVGPGQGFLAKANNGTTVNFAENNQSAQTTDTFLRTNTESELKLLMTDGKNNRFAKIFFTDTATTGFDIGWEGEVFGGIATTFDVYSQLVSRIVIHASNKLFGTKSGK